MLKIYLIQILFLFVKYSLFIEKKWNLLYDTYRIKRIERDIMDNVVQNIGIDDIVLSDVQQNYNPHELKELTLSIQKYGVLEPILVRPKNGKYEIILGNKRYCIAKKLGFTTIPALIKNVSDEIVEQYKRMNVKSNLTNAISKEETVSKNSIGRQKKLPRNLEIPLEKKEQLKNNENSLNQRINSIKFNHDNNDIVNLLELSKEEYERDEKNMNNTQFDNNMMNNNLGGIPTQNAPSNQGPTFGGRFFPSLEDEPTNMNLNLNNVQPQMVDPQMSNNMNPNSNLIDLTDMSAEREPSMMPNNTLNMPAQAPMMDTNPEFANFNTQPVVAPMQSAPVIDNIVPNFGASPMPMDNVINLDNLQATPQMDSFQSGPMNPMQQSVEMQQSPEFAMNMSAPVSPTTVESVPQFDMSTTLNAPQFNQLTEMNSMNSVPQNDYTMNVGVNSPIEVQTLGEMNNENFGTAPIVNTEPMNQMIGAEQQFPQKEVLPVINTIKGVATSLEAFGYQIRIYDEDTTNSYNLIIEVDK